MQRSWHTFALPFSPTFPQHIFLPFISPSPLSFPLPPFLPFCFIICDLAFAVLLECQPLPPHTIFSSLVSLTFALLYNVSPHFWSWLLHSLQDRPTLISIDFFLPHKPTFLGFKWRSATHSNTGRGVWTLKQEEWHFWKKHFLKTFSRQILHTNKHKHKQCTCKMTPRHTHTCLHSALPKDPNEQERQSCDSRYERSQILRVNLQ